jgi:hypothetical protein
MAECIAADRAAQGDDLVAKHRAESTIVSLLPGPVAIGRRCDAKSWKFRVVHSILVRAHALLGATCIDTVTTIRTHLSEASRMLKLRLPAFPIVFAALFLFLSAGRAAAQSTIAGVVRDSSGGVLPGVVVEAASPVLIEKVRSVTSDADGRYSLVDLRPGSYVLTFALPGFATVKREGITVAAGVSVPINVDLRVGDLQETITVSGATPVVDVQTIATTQILPREVLDAIPTGRSIWSVGQVLTGVTLNSPDVGGSRGMQQTYMSVHGLSSGGQDNTVLVDGMMINALQTDGAVQTHLNDAMIQETTYQTSGVGADTSGGGVRMNIIPRDGGNKTSGAMFTSWEGKALESDNLSDELRTRGLRTVDSVDKVWDLNLSQGGPVLTDRLWYFGSFRHWGVNAPIADTFHSDGTAAGTAACLTRTIECPQGIDDQHAWSALARLTWQISPRHKLAAYYDRTGKHRGHAMTAGTDAATAAVVWNKPLDYNGQVKLTSTLTNRLMFEGGYSTNIENYTNDEQPGIAEERFSPAWYARAPKQDRGQGTSWNAVSQRQVIEPKRFNLQASMSYVTGSHNLKVGLQDTFGPETQSRDRQADLTQVYLNGIPDSVIVANTPIYLQNYLKAGAGIYGMDSWTIDRLTVSAGLRWEYINGQIQESYSAVGRFVPARIFPETRDLPNWKNWAPRFGAAYDVFGNARTALKFGANRYFYQMTTSFPGKYNPQAFATSTLPWRDANGDDIAQNSEISFTNLPTNFGTRSLNAVDPDIRRTYSNEVSVQVQQELVPRVSVSVGWFHRRFHDLTASHNLLLSPSDWTPVQVVSPLNGEAITVYNLNRAKAGQVQNFDTNAPDDPDQRSLSYNGFEYAFNMRLPGGATMFGGATTERSIRVGCDLGGTGTFPSSTPTGQDDPNTLRFCDQRTLGIPWLTQVKLSGTYPLWRGIQVSGVLQSYAGRALSDTNTTPASPTVWRISQTTRYADGTLVVPGMTQTTLVVPLVAPSTEFLDRTNQVDLSFAKWFGFGTTRIQGQVDVFNAFNQSPVLDVRSADFGTAAYLQPSRTLQGRLVRLGLQVKW